MGVTIFFIVIIFILWLRYELKKSSRTLQNANDKFWEREELANSTRKKSTDSLNYITISEKSLPFLEINDEIVAKCVSRLVFLKDKKILNLTGKTNTDLKLEYGAANLTYLSECDENYTTLSRTLNTYSARLYELGYESEARKVLEFAVETGSDSLSMYRLLADIYSGRNEADSLEYLLFKANQLDSMLKKTIVNDVSSRISK
mgnify:CR=1 FL=1